jgi:hypothetical protein
MPVILENGSEALRTWLDPKRSTWSKDLQSLLKPFNGELEIYPVSKDVGKVGNNSPNFIIPVASTENKSNIANFFAKGATKKQLDELKVSAATSSSKFAEPEDVKIEESTPIDFESGENRETIGHEGTEDNASLPVPKSETKQGIKIEWENVPDEEPPNKIPRISPSPKKAKSSSKPAGRSRSATSNNTASPKQPMMKEKGSQKITSFFGK